MKAKSPASARKSPARATLGSRPIAGKDHRFIVSLASASGGGRQIVYARNFTEAANKAAINKFAKAKRPKGLSAIVTDWKTGKQRFY